jgi:hypothetical protein
MKKFLLTTFLFVPLLFTNSCATYTREIAYANFSDLPKGPTKTDGYNIQGEGWDTNKNALRLTNKGSFLSMQFYVDEVPKKAVLAVEHASVTAPNCTNNGYSPVTIKINDAVVVSNFSPATHNYSTKSFNVTTFLKTGENAISWTASDLCSSYVLKNWSIFDDSQDYYVASSYYDSWPRNYYYRPGFSIYSHRRVIPYYQPKFYFNYQYQGRYESNNQHRHFENKQKRSDRKYRGKR